MGEVQLGQRVSLTGEAAWVPFASLDDTDNHHLRPAINPLPIDGDAMGVQLEAILNVAVTNSINVGIGGRYWHMGPSDGIAHFEQTPGGGIPQVAEFESNRYGVFVQASMTFP